MASSSKQNHNSTIITLDSDDEDIVFLKEIPGSESSSTCLPDTPSKKRRELILVSETSESPVRKHAKNAGKQTRKAQEILQLRMKQVEDIKWMYGEGGVGSEWGVRCETVDVWEEKIVYAVSLCISPTWNHGFTLEIALMDAPKRSINNVKTFPPVHVSVEYPSLDDKTAKLILRCSWLRVEQVRRMSGQMALVLNANGDLPAALRWLENESIAFLGIIQRQKLVYITSAALGKVETNKPNVIAVEDLGALEAAFQKAILSQMSFQDTPLLLSKAFDCPVCNDRKASMCHAVVFPDCKHYFCRVCVSQEFSLNIRKGKLKELVCLNDRCKKAVAVDFISTVVDAETFTRFCQYAAEQFVNDNDSIVRCPKETCNAAMELARNGPREIDCLVCQHRFCSLCNGSPHPETHCRPSAPVYPNLTPRAFAYPLTANGDRDQLMRDFMAKQLAKEKPNGYHERIRIDEGATGFGLESVFRPYIDFRLTTAEIDDPYIHRKWQTDKFVELCAVLVKHARNITVIRLKTTRPPDRASCAWQDSVFNELQQGLLGRDVALYVTFSDTLHDRETRFDNGWTIKIGRGLDYFQKWESMNTLDFIDLNFRKCKETTIDAMYKPQTSSLT